MEAPAPPPRRRHRRKASDAAAAALAAQAASYSDVFGGPPRFAPPPQPAAAPADYSEVFGGVAASCSIPYLDLPPAVDEGAGAAAGGYGEIFGRFDFGDFAVPYEDMLPGAECFAGEIASPSGSSRSSIRKESGELDAEPSILYQQYPDAACDQHFEEEHFYPVSLPPNGEQRFSMSYNKATRGRPDDLVEMTTCIVEPSISYVVDSCNFSNGSEADHVPVIDSYTNATGVKGKMSPNFSNDSDIDHAPVMDNDSNANAVKGKMSPNFSDDSEIDHAPAMDSGTTANGVEVKMNPNFANGSEMVHAPIMDSGTNANCVKEKMSPPSALSSSLKGANSDPVVDQQHHIPTGLPISENICEDENYNKRSSTHSVSSEDAPSPDYPFLRVSDISLPAAPIKVQPPPMPSSKLLNKKGSKENGDSDVNSNSAAAAAAMKQAMEFAEVRLKAAKELMERKGGSFKFQKRPAHHRSTKSTEIKESKTPEEVHAFEEKFNVSEVAKEENQNMDTSLLDKNRGGSAVMSVQCDDDQNGIQSLAKPQEMMQNCSKLEHLGNWTSDAEFYELISHDLICRPNAAACKGNDGLMTNSCTIFDQYEKEKTSGFAGEPKRVRKMWDRNNTSQLRTEHVNQVKDGIASVEAEQKTPILPDIQFCEESGISQGPNDSHLKQCPGDGYSLGHDDVQFDVSCMKSTPAEVHCDLETSSSFLEHSLSGGHASDNKSHSDSVAKETSLAENSNHVYKNKEGVELPCTSVRSQILQVHPNDPIADESKGIDAKMSKLEEPSESCEKEKLFNVVDEASLRNEIEIEVTSESPIHEEMKEFEIEYTTDAHEDFEEVDMDQVAESTEEEGYVTSGSVNANESENEEAEVLHTFVGDSKLAESNLRTRGAVGKDPYQLHQSQGSLGPRDLENRMVRVEDIVSQESLLENVEKPLVEEVLNHESMEGQKSMETNAHKRSYDGHVEVNVTSDIGCNQFNSDSEFITDDGSDCAVEMSILSNSTQPCFTGASTSMQHLPQNTESMSADKGDKCTPVCENIEVDCKGDGEIPTKIFTELEEEKNTGSKMEERDSNHSILNINFEGQQSFYLDSDIIPNAAEDPESETVLKPRQESVDVQRTKERNDVTQAEGEIEEVLMRPDEKKEKECKMGKEKKQNKERRLDEDKEKECKMEKERRLQEQKKKECKMEKQKDENEERRRRELEEEKEREMERAKDRLAVQRATREAHERAFAEVRAKAERIALERITSARQRASAEAREKEEKTTAQAATEKASREARMKAERAAVERATAEARERAIEKAKAAADAKERMERFRSSFKDSFKSTNQDNLQETQFQKTASNNHGKSTNSCIEVVEVESALRHKAKMERHQRTAERAAKALAEKNMRDMLAQREQAEKHRLAEFLDPEVKRWSNGKEGNLRALLSTLQYILGSDSGWQSVPLTDLITAAGVKKAYRKATLCVHPDKVQQRGATIRQKYICEKVFDLLKEAWNKYNSEER